MKEGVRRWNSHSLSRVQFSSGTARGKIFLQQTKFLHNYTCLCIRPLFPVKPANPSVGGPKSERCPFFTQMIVLTKLKRGKKRILAKPRKEWM